MTNDYWPWHIKVTRTDGTVTENDYSNDFDAPAYAKWASTKDTVARVELSVAFVAGEAVAQGQPVALEPCLMCGDPTSNGLLCEHCEAGQDEEAKR